jgi:GNAT superfamily N-acetyltransferase
MRLFRSRPRIVLAVAHEAAAIAGLYSRAWEPHRGRLDERLISDQTPGAEEVAAWLNGGFEVFTATLDGQLVGVVRCSFPTGTCLVDRMAVDPDRNSQGVGRVLAEHAIARARRAGVTKVWVQATPKLEEVVNLYRSLGFRESAHLRAHYWGEDVTLMELPL